MQDPGSIPDRAALCFSSDPAASSSFFVGEREENLIGFVIYSSVKKNADVCT